MLIMILNMYVKLINLVSGSTYLIFSGYERDLMSYFSSQRENIIFLCCISLFFYYYI
jgi:hypothetical protein